MSKKEFKVSKGPSSPPPPRRLPDSLRSEDTVEALLGLGEGPFAGLQTGRKSFFIGDTPLENADGSANYEDFELQVFKGSAFGEPVSFDLGGTSANTTVGINITNAGGAVSRTTVAGQTFDTIEIRLVVNQLFKTTTEGDILNNELLFKIEYQKSGDATWTSILSNVGRLRDNGNGSTGFQSLGDYGAEIGSPVALSTLERTQFANDANGNFGFGLGGTIASYDGAQRIYGKTTSPYVREIRIPVTPPTTAETYTIRITKLSPDSTTTDFADFTWESFQLVTSGTTTHPNLAMVKVLGRASNQFSSLSRVWGIYNTSEVLVPSVYNPVTRDYDLSTPWDGSMVVAFTNNPAWVLYDAITNGVSGLSAISQLNWDKYEAFALSQWFDNINPTTGAFIGVPDGKGGVQPRYTLNVSIDSPRSGKEFLDTLAGAVGCRAYEDGLGNFTVKADQPGTVEHIFGREDLVEGDEFNYASTDVNLRYNDISVAFLDDSQLYKQDRRILQDTASIAANGKISLNFPAVGCTNVQEAIRRATYRKIVSQKETQTATFTTTRKGMYVEPFSIISIADSRRGNGLSRRVKSISGDRLTVTLRDVDAINLTAGNSYSISVGTSVYYNLTAVASTGPVTQLVTTSALPVGLPGNFSIYLKGGEYGTPKDFRIIGVEVSDEEPDIITLSGIEIYANKWTEVDNATFQAGSTGGTLPGDIPLPVSNVVAKLIPRSTAQGPVDDVVLTWDASGDAADYIVTYVRNGEDDVVLATPKTRSATLQDAPPGSYKFFVAARNAAGDRSPTKRALIQVLDPNVTIPAMTTNLIWGTEDLTLEWQVDTTTNPWKDGNIGAQHPDFKDFTVEVFDGTTLVDSTIGIPWVNNQLVFTYADLNTWLVTLKRSFDLKVTFNPLSTAGATTITTTVVNGAPAVPIVTVTSSFDEVQIDYDDPTDGDFAGMIVWMSDTSPVVMDASSEVWHGMGNPRIPAVAGKTMYYRYALYDNFSTSELDISVEDSIFINHLGLSNLPVDLKMVTAPSGMISGVAGDMVFEPNKLADGTINNGEIRLTDSSDAGSTDAFFFHPTLPPVVLSVPLTISTPWEGGATPVGGVFYVFWSSTALATRFPGWSGNANFGTLVYDQVTDIWTAYGNAGTGFVLTPDPADVILAAGSAGSTNIAAIKNMVIPMTALEGSNGNVFVKGNLLASGSIAGESIAATTSIQVGTGLAVGSSGAVDRAVMAGAGIDNNKYRFFAGSLVGETAPFSVDDEGNAIFRSITLSTPDGGARFFDSTNGFSDFARSQLLGGTGSVVGSIASVLSSNTSTKEFTVTTNTAVQLVAEIELKALGITQKWIVGSTQPTPQWPTSLKVDIKYRDKAVGGAYTSAGLVDFVKGTNITVATTITTPAVEDKLGGQVFLRDGSVTESVTSPSIVQVSVPSTTFPSGTYEVIVEVTTVGTTPFTTVDRTLTCTVLTGSGFVLSGTSTTGLSSGVSGSFSGLLDVASFTNNANKAALLNSTATGVIFATASDFTSFIFGTDYGIVANGAANNDAAFQAFLDALTGNKLTGILPAGTINLTKQFTIPEGCIIHGMGRGNTNLLWKAGAGNTQGFKWTPATGFSSFDIGHMSLYTETPGAGTAFDISVAAGIGVNGSRFTPHDLTIMQDEAGLGYWSVAFKLNNVSYTTLRNIKFWGSPSFPTVGALGGYWGDFCQLSGESLELRFESCDVNFCDTAISGTSLSEGVHVLNCEFAFVRRGVVLVSSVGVQPLFSCIGSHMNAFERCISLNGYHQSYIGGNHLSAAAHPTNPGAFNAVSLVNVELINCKGTQVMGNQVLQEAIPTTKTAVTQLVSISSTDGAIVSSNSFYGAISTAYNPVSQVIVLGSTTTNTKVDPSNSYFGFHGVKISDVNANNNNVKSDFLGDVTTTGSLIAKDRGVTDLGGQVLWENSANSFSAGTFWSAVALNENWLLLDKAGFPRITITQGGDTTLRDGSNLDRIIVAKNAPLFLNDSNGTGVLSISPSAANVTGTLSVSSTITQAGTAVSLVGHAHDAADTTTGIFNTLRIPSLDATKITTGVLGTARIPSLAASKITSGTLASARIPSLAASKITSGTFPLARIPTGTTSSTVALGNHNHDAVYAKLSGAVFTGISTFSSTLTVNGDLILGAHAGEGGQITFQGAAGTDWVFDSAGSQMRLFTAAGNFSMVAEANAAISLYHANSVKLATTSLGIDVTGAVNTISDIRFKKYVLPLSNCLDTVMDIRPVGYTERESGALRYGVIAQELQKIVPRLVGQNAEGYLNVNYSGIIPLLIGSVQELKEEVTTLKKLVIDKSGL